MAGIQGWNRCDCCCQFFSPDKHGMEGDEHHSLDINGNLHTSYTLVCGRCKPMIHDHPWIKRKATVGGEG